METHRKKILSYLQQTNGGLSSWEAIHMFRCTRLAARIADLKDEGYRIETTMETSDLNGKRFARYFLLGER